MCISMYICIELYVFIYIYMYVIVCIYTCVYIYIHSVTSPCFSTFPNGRTRLHILGQAPSDTDSRHPPG